MQLLAAVILAVTFLVVGFLIGNMFPILGNEDEDTRRARLERELEEAPEQHGLNEVARLWRNQESKRLVVQMDGEHLPHKSDLTPEQHGALSLLLVDLQEWVGLPAQMETTPAQAETSQPEPIEDIPPEPMISSPVENQEEPKGRRFSAIEMIKRAVESDVKLPQAASLVSIVLQIDQVLQEQLRGTALESQGIELRELPGGGMEVRVGLQHYATIDEVPDPEVQAAIRRAVASWEAGEKR